MKLDVLYRNFNRNFRWAQGRDCEGEPQERGKSSAAPPVFPPLLSFPLALPFLISPLSVP